MYGNVFLSNEICKYIAWFNIYINVYMGALIRGMHARDSWF
jgi:hypothetical protein